MQQSQIGELKTAFWFKSCLSELTPSHQILLLREVGLPPEICAPRGRTCIRFSARTYYTFLGTASHETIGRPTASSQERLNEADRRPERRTLLLPMRRPLFGRRFSRRGGAGVIGLNIHDLKDRLRTFDACTNSATARSTKSSGNFWLASI